MSKVTAFFAATWLLAACSSERRADYPLHGSGHGATSGYGIDFRAMGWTGPVMNQQFVGSCTAFGVTATMNSMLRRGGRNESVSPMHVWAELKLRTGMSNDLVNVAVAPLEAWAYDPVKACLIAMPDDECAKAGYPAGSGQLSPALNMEWMAANFQERYRVLGVDNVYSKYDPALSDKEVIFAHLARGEALDGTILVGDGFNDPDEVIGDYPVGEGSAGHAVALVGFRAAGGERQVLLQNSWGTDWGDGGFAWLPEHMIGTQLTSAARLTLADARAPLPAANGRCDGWHHLDLVLDACFATCRNHTPTVNGRCNPMPRNESSPIGNGCDHWRDILSGQCTNLGTAIPGFQWPRLY
jgi:hypothetical protein